MRRGPVWASEMAVLAAVVSGCAQIAALAPRDGASSDGIQLSYEHVLAPQVFSREGAAVADGPDGEAGFWAVAPGLPRPERGRVENLATGATIDVALYAGRGGAIRLSAATAEAIGIGPEPERVRVTALRREPRIAAP